ncbi:MAG: hypothetical protein IJ087_05480 [Eggerthellaceae bacterium]|nr:hypothetical protein [Eggerthellaceae bacterium]
MATDESPTIATDAAAGDAASEAAPKHEPVKRSASAGRSSSDEKKPRKRRLWLRVLIAVFVVFVVLVGALVALFAWDRWYRYDDAADFQGKWYPAGATSAVEISADKLSFDAETAYDYTLDTDAKTITYSLGNLRGHGRYWFANDRTALVIVDDGYTANYTLLDDVGRALANLADKISGNAPALPTGDGYTVFTRTPDPAAVAAKAEAERQAKAAEQAAREAEEAAARADQEASEAAERTTEDASKEQSTGEEANTDKKPEEEPKNFANESMGIL